MLAVIFAVIQVRNNKIGVILGACAPIVLRLGCPAETWAEFVKNHRKRFRNEAGLSQNRRTFRSTRRESRARSTASS